MDNSIKTVEQFFEPNRMAFREWKGNKTKQLSHSVSAKKQTLKILKHCFWGRAVIYSQIFASCAGGLG
jgi:hypothetical protein